MSKTTTTTKTTTAKATPKKAVATTLPQGWHFGNMFIVSGGIIYLSKLVEKKKQDDGKYPCRALIEIWHIVDERVGKTGTTYECERTYNDKTYTLNLSTTNE